MIDFKNFTRTSQLQDLYDDQRNDLRFRDGEDFSPGMGNLDPKIMFVAQDLFDAQWYNPEWKDLVDLAGVQDGEVYMTTLVKHRMPANRPPRKEEIQAGYDYLEPEIDLVRPRVVGLINNAVQFVFPDSKITSVHGRTITTKLNHGHVMWVPLFGVRYMQDHRNRRMVESGYMMINIWNYAKGARV